MLYPPDRMIRRVFFPFRHSPATFPPAQYLNRN